MHMFCFLRSLLSHSQTPFFKTSCMHALRVKLSPTALFFPGLQFSKLAKKAYQKVTGSRHSHLPAGSHSCAQSLMKIPDDWTAQEDTGLEVAIHFWLLKHHLRCPEKGFHEARCDFVIMTWTAPLPVVAPGSLTGSCVWSASTPALLARFLLDLLFGCLLLACCISGTLLMGRCCHSRQCLSHSWEESGAFAHMSLGCMRDELFCSSHGPLVVNLSFCLFQCQWCYPSASFDKAMICLRLTIVSRVHTWHGFLLRCPYTCQTFVFRLERIYSLVGHTRS